MRKSEHLKECCQSHNRSPELKIQKHQNIYRNASSYLETKKQKIAPSVIR